MSNYSTSLEVLFAVEPKQQDAAPVFVSRSGGDTTYNLAPFIEISWVPPHDDGGSSILGYFVEMKENSAATWTTIYDGGT